MGSRAWNQLLRFSFPSSYQEDSILVCVLLCFWLLSFLFLTYSTDIMGHTQSMTLLNLILGHLQDFRVGAGEPSKGEATRTGASMWVAMAKAAIDTHTCTQRHSMYAQPCLHT